MGCEPDELPVTSGIRRSGSSIPVTTRPRPATQTSRLRIMVIDIGIPPSGSYCVTTLSFGVTPPGQVGIPLQRAESPPAPRKRSVAPPSISRCGPDGEGMNTTPSIAEQPRPAAVRLPTVEVTIPVYNEEGTLPRS